MLSHFSHVQLFATPWIAAYQASLSMEFSRQEYWRGLPFPPPWDLPDPGIEPTSLKSPSLEKGSLPLASPGKPHFKGFENAKIDVKLSLFSIDELRASLVTQLVKKFAYNMGDLNSIPVLGRAPGEGTGYLLGPSPSRIQRYPKHDGVGN